MAAILKLRRGTSASPTLTDGEIFLNYTTGTVQFASGSGASFLISNLLPLDKSINGTIILDGNISASNLYLTGDITARDFNGRDIRLSGNIYLGDEVADNISVTAQFSGSLIPSASDSYNLGSDIRRWSELHVSSAFADTATILDITLPSSRILSSSLGNYQDFDTFSGSVDTRFNILNSYTESTDQRLTSIEGFTQSVDLRVDKLEASQSYFDDTYSGSVDTRLVNLELTGSDHESRIDEIETTFSSSVDNRLDLLELTGSNHENRITNLEFFSSSEYQTDSQSFDDRIQDLTSVTGSYATTGSNLFIGNQIITGSLQTSGSNVIFQGLPWPSNGFETHFLLTQPYTHNGRSYEGAAIGLELTSSFGTVYENSILIHNYDNHVNPDYGTELNVGSNRVHIMAMTSGSNRLANVSVEDVGDETTRTLIYGDDIQIGLFTGSTIQIGNNDSVNMLRGSVNYVVGDIDSIYAISASEFVGDGSKLINLQHTNIIFDGSGILSSSISDFNTYSASIDNRLSTIEGPLSSSIENQLNTIQSYTASLKNAINVNGIGENSTTTILGNLIVQGETTTINTTELVVKDKLLAIASGSTTSAQANEAGFFISGANASFTWNHPNQLLEFNTKISSSVGFKGDGSELINIPSDGIVFDGSGIVSGSSQIDLTLTTNYESGIKSRLNTEGVISSSVQVNADNITNFDSNVKDKMIDELVHSGSYFATATTSTLSEGTNLYYTNERVKIKLNTEGVISGSTQLTGSFLEVNGDDVVSGSSQIDLTQTTNYESGIKDRLNFETVLSGSQQLTGSLDSRYLKINGDNVVSGSSQISFNGIVDKPTLVSGSEQIQIDSVTGFTTFSSSVDDRLDSLEIDQHNHTNKSNLDTINQNLSSSDSPTFNSIILSNLDNKTIDTEFNGVLYSSSGELVYSQFGDAIYYNVSSSIANGDPNVLGNASAVKNYIDEQLIIIGAGDITAVLAGDGMSGGALSGSATLTLDTGSSHFTNGVVLSLPSGIISGSTFTTFSSSVDTRLVDLENFSSSLDVDYITQGELASATGSLINSINEKLDSSSFNLYTQSTDLRLTDLENFSSSLDTEYVTQIELASATGSLINSISTKLDTGSYNTDSQSFDSRLNSIQGVTGSYATTGSNTFVGNQVISGSVNIQNSISSVNYIDFRDGSSTTYQEGRLFYDENEGALSFYNNEADITLNLGQEFYKKVFNSSGATILNGTPVKVSGSQGDMALIWPATAPDHSNTFGVFENHIIGVATHDIEDSSTGYVTERGLVRNLNTSPFTAGDTLFLQTGSPVQPEDYYRNTPPPFPYDVVQVGTVIRSNPGNGFIEVSPREPIHFGVISGLSGSSATTGDLWVRKSNNSWTPSKTLEGNYTIIGSISASAYSGVISSSAQIDVTQTQNYNEVVQISGSQTIVGEKTFGGTQTFQNIAVNGTGSFAYIQSITGSAKIIGDSFIILNNNTPAERYAGFSVYDSGSEPTIPTASFFFDGLTQDFKYEYVEGDLSTTAAIALFGPEMNDRSGSVYLTTNTLPKASGGHHLGDSNITDSGTLITLGSNVQVNGNISVTGTVDGIDLQNFSSSVDSRIDTLEGTSNENPLSFVDTATIDFTRTGDNIFADVIGGVVSGSSQIDVTQTTNYSSINQYSDTKVKDKLNLDGVISGSNFASPSQGNLNAVINGNTQSIDLGLQTTDTVQFAKVGIGGAADATYELKVTGDIGATGDVVAYISSDRRLKDEITPIENSLQKINSIGGYSFVWNEKQDIYSGKDYGVIAQEIENILPELVETRENGYKAVKYDRIVSLLIEGIKELSKEVSELKEKIGK